MVDRSFDFNPSVTNVTATMPDSAPAAIGEAVQEVAKASEQSKVLMYGAQAHAQFKALDAQFRMQYADNPSDKQGLQDLQDARKQIAENLGGNISPFYKRQWETKIAQIAEQSDASNDAWSVHQNYRNAVNNTNTAMKTYLDMGNKDGQAFGVSDGTDGSAIMNFLTAHKQIASTVTPFIGSDKAEAMMKNFNADYVKSFVAGVAEHNPERALELVNSDEIGQHFSTMDKEDMIGVIERTQKMQKMAASLSTTNNDGQLMDLVNDNSMSYYEKRAEIDRLDLQGAISPQAASKARRVIKSSSDLDAQTDTPAMASIINQIYDLNANATTNPDDYLRGVRNVQNKILDMQADGSLTAPDAKKLQGQVRNLTSAKLSSATQMAGLEFYDANQKFDVLPAEFRGEATRQLFYMSDGKNFTPQQFQNAAMSIIDSINKNRRDAAQASLKAMSQSDQDLLHSMGATEADVEATAQKHHISKEEVIRQIRQHRLAQKGGRAGRVNKIGQEAGDNSEPIQKSTQDLGTGSDNMNSDTQDEGSQE